MRKRLFVALAFLTLAGFGFQTASAQLPSGIPRFPRPGKPKATPTPAPAENAQPAPKSETQPDTGAAAAPAAAAPAPAAGQALPPIAKDWVLVRADTRTSYKGNFDIWSWLPLVTFRSNIEQPSGARYYVVVTQPNGTPWIELKCDSNGISHECGSPHTPDEQGINAVGVISFTIKMKNPLAGTDQTLFTGKAKVEKAPSGDHSTRWPNKFSYFVNSDWALPIGYVFKDDNWPAVAFTVRGTNSSGLQLHVFYKGREVGAQQGPFSCSSTELNGTPTRSTAEAVPQGGTWERVSCSLKGLTWDGEEVEGYHSLVRNPGEYEVKVLWNKKLSRTFKFTVGPDGRFADNGIARANGINAERVIVPIAVVGPQDGQWDRNAWKTDAFFGHPLKGFAGPPQ